MSKKSDSELERVVKSSGTYAEEARLAAALELKNRGIVTKQIVQIGYELETKLEAEKEEQKFKDKFIPKNWIYGFAGILTPLVVGIFMAINIWSLGERKGIWTVLLIAFAYLPLIIFIVELTPPDINRLVVSFFHLGYVVFFVEWTWKKYIPTYEQHKNAQNRSQRAI